MIVVMNFVSKPVVNPFICVEFTTGVYVMMRNVCSMMFCVTFYDE